MSAVQNRFKQAKVPMGGCAYMPMMNAGAQ